MFLLSDVKTVALEEVTHVDIRLVDDSGTLIMDEKPILSFKCERRRIMALENGDLSIWWVVHQPCGGRGDRGTVVFVVKVNDSGDLSLLVGGNRVLGKSIVFSGNESSYA